MIGVGVIGYGYWGPNLVRNFSESGTGRVVALADLSLARLEKAGARDPGLTLRTDPEDILKDPRVDAVAIATPVSTHFELALRALSADKHVLIEKPLATSSEQCARLIDEAQRRGLVLMVDHTFVYTGAVRKIREFVKEGRLGKLYYYDSVRVNLGLFQHDVNVLWDLAVHDLSIMDFVLGRAPKAVSAAAVSHLGGQPENIAYLTLFFEGALIGHVSVNWLAPVKIRRTLISGSKRMIVYDDLEPSEKVKVYDRGITVNSTPESLHQLRVGYRVGDLWAPQVDGAEALLTGVRHFLGCVARSERPLTDGEAGLRVVRLLEAATHSVQAQGRLVEVSA